MQRFCFVKESLNVTLSILFVSGKTIEEKSRPKRRKLFRHKHCRRFNADFGFSLLAAPLVLDLLHSGKEFLTQLIDSEAKIRSDGRPILLQGLSTAVEILPKVTKKRMVKSRP